jgi:hypothetical protein
VSVRKPVGSCEGCEVDWAEHSGSWFGAHPDDGRLDELPSAVNALLRAEAFLVSPNRFGHGRRALAH